MMAGTTFPARHISNHLSNINTLLIFTSSLIINMAASSASQHQAREQLSTKDNSVMYRAGYALVTVLLIWLDWSGVPTDTAFDITTHWIGSLCLLIASFTLLDYILEVLGEAAMPDDEDKGTSRASIDTWRYGAP